MALLARRQPERRRVPASTSVTASGARIEFNPEGKPDDYAARKRERWQERAWEMYDLLGIVRFPARFMGDAFARIRLYVGVKPDSESEPIPLKPEGDADLGYTAEEAKLAIAQLDRLKGPEGGIAEIMRRIGTHLFVPGECYLVGRRADESQPASVDNERWDIYSIDQFIVDSDDKKRNDAGEMVPTFKLKTGGNEPKTLPNDTVAIRIWRPHPRMSYQADSPMRAALPICERILLLEQSIIAGALSRAKGPGVWIMPSSMRSGSTTPNTEGDGQATKNDSVVNDLITAVGTAIQDPESAYAQVPVVLWVDDDLWKDQSWKDKLITWDRDIDAVAAEQREEARTEFAVAIDLPPEILTGVAGVNHWGMWFIGDDTFQSNVEPYVILADSALTSSFLWASLRLEGMTDPERFVIWHDETDLVSDPDKSDRAMTAHGAFLISDERARRDMNYGEDDMPGDAEVAKRVAIAQAIRSSPGSALPAEGPPVQASMNGHRAITAAANLGTPLPGFAERVGVMDRALLAEVQTEADARMRRALEKANARLKVLAQSDKTIAATVKDITADSLQIAPTLGPDLVQRLATRPDGTEEELFSFAAFGAWFITRTGRTSAEVIRMAQRDGNLSNVEAAELERELAGDREAASGLLVATLLSLAAVLLGRPEAPKPPGETDGRLVPMGAVRNSLARAGGGGTKATSMLNGDTVGRLWSQAGIDFGGWRWVYGDPSMRITPFPPHEDLAGLEFDGPDDEALGNPTGWPTDLCWPQDHASCLCGVERTGASVKESADLVSVGGEL